MFELTHLSGESTKNAPMSERFNRKWIGHRKDIEWKCRVRQIQNRKGWAS